MEAGKKLETGAPSNRLLGRLVRYVLGHSVGTAIDLDKLAEKVGTRKNPLHPGAVSRLLRGHQDLINDKLHGSSYPEGAGRLVYDKGRWAVAQIVRRYPDQHTATDTSPELNTVEDDHSTTLDMVNILDEGEVVKVPVAPRRRKSSKPNSVDQRNGGNERFLRSESCRQALGVLNRAGVPMFFPDIIKWLDIEPSRQEFREIIGSLQRIGLVNLVDGIKISAMIDPYARPLLDVSDLGKLDDPGVFFGQCREYAKNTTSYRGNDPTPPVSPILFGLCEGLIGKRVVDLNKLAEVISDGLNKYGDVKIGPEQIALDIMELTESNMYIKVKEGGGYTSLSMANPEGSEGPRRQRAKFYKLYPFINNKFKK